MKEEMNRKQGTESVRKTGDRSLLRTSPPPTVERGIDDRELSSTSLFHRKTKLSTYSTVRPNPPSGLLVRRVPSSSLKRWREKFRVGLSALSPHP